MRRLLRFVLPIVLIASTAGAQPALPRTEPPGVRLTQKVAVNEYTVRIYGGDLCSYAEILHTGKRVWSKRGFMFWLGAGEFDGLRPTPTPGADVTGDGVPDLVISEFTGGAHCSSLVHIFSLGPPFHKLCTLDGVHSDIRFADLDHDGVPEVILRDWTFAYWQVCFASSHGPKVILRYKDGGYRMATDLMRRDSSSNAQIDQRARHIVAQWSKQEPFSENLADLWRTMLDLIYSGNADTAWQLFYLAYPDNNQWEPREEMLAAFKQQLRKSHFWPDLLEMNAGKM